MKKFLSMFFMLSVLPTIGLAVVATSTPYEATDKHDTDLADINSETNIYKKEYRYKEYCKELLKFTKDYNIQTGATFRGYYQTIREDGHCDVLVSNHGGKGVTEFADNIHSKIQNRQKQVVIDCCNLGDRCRYKTIDDSHGYTAKGDPAVTCSATANDERCLLTQKLEDRNLMGTKDGYDKKYYYSCNRPELEFRKFSDGSGYIGVKKNLDTCGAKGDIEHTAGFINQKIKLTLDDFDENCQPKYSALKDLVLHKYGSDEEENALIEKLSIERGRAR